MSVLDVTQAVSNTTNSSILSSFNAEQQSDQAKSGEYCFAPDGVAIATQTELANYNFYLRVLKIEGIYVSLSDAATWSEKIITVTVPDLLDEKAGEVFGLESSIYDIYPTARLNVCVLETASGA